MFLICVMLKAGVMSTRIHIVLDEAEKELFRRQAKLEGKSLAAWIREAARERLAAAQARRTFQTVEELRAFYRASDAAETRREPDWEEHRRVIERSIRSGGGEP